jgi:two-component system cell cycle response regulator CpdR
MIFARKLSTRGTKPARCALLAEDDPEMRALVADALRIDGFEVEEVGDGRNMSLRVAQSVYDLVVSDMRLPLGDGLTVLEDLHERAPSTGTHMILMTAFADDSARKRSATIGAVLIEKPFKLSELRAAARQLCQEVVPRGIS